nr:MAG TPA: hypothetical protein [Caudoviricetes sp.]
MSDLAYMMNDDIVSQADFNDPQVAEYVKAEFQKAIQERIKSLTEIANSLKAGLDKYDIDNMNDLDLVMKDVRRIEDHAEDARIDLAYFSLVFAKWHKPSEKPRSDDKYNYKYLVRFKDEGGLHLECTWFDPETNKWQLGDAENVTILGWCEKTDAWSWGEP